MWPAALSEVLGTFIFASTIFAVTKEAIAPLFIGIALTVSIIIAMQFGKAFLNPAIVLGFFARGDINMQTAVVYIVSEIVGALLAVVWWKLASKD
jgi:glycerol uptake facilitator-like aquaporin